MLISICRAVHHAHGRGVIHRDLKPANISVDGAGHFHLRHELLRMRGSILTTLGRLDDAMRALDQADAA